jgi:hypothetical protein
MYSHTMKRILLLTFMLSLKTLDLLAQDPCDCIGTNQDVQYRTKSKHETHYEKYPLVKDTISPKVMISWQKRYKKKVKDVNRKNVQKLRVRGTPEDSMYILKGYMYFVKHEKSSSGDCDFHIEIGTEKKSGKRVVVEMTKEKCSEQKRVLDYIKSKGYRLGKEFKKGIPCIVIGLGFYDGWHTPNQHGRKNTHGSSWELHPVKDIIFI